MGIKSKTHFHTPITSRSWKCAWLKQVTTSYPLRKALIMLFRGEISAGIRLRPHDVRSRIPNNLDIRCFLTYFHQDFNFDILSIRYCHSDILQLFFFKILL